MKVVEAAFLNKPNLLQVRVEHRSEKQVARLQQEVASLHTEVEKQQHLDMKFLGRIDLLSRRIDGLQEAFKTGDVKYLGSEAQPIRASHLSTFLLLVISGSFSITLF